METVSLDDALRNESDINFLKMDAEGSECFIIEGAHDLIERSPNI